MLAKHKSIAVALGVASLALCVFFCGLLAGPEQWNERSGKTHNISRSARLSRASGAPLQQAGQVFYSPQALSAGVIVPVPILTRVFEEASLERLLLSLLLGCVSGRSPPVS
jgi:hypothetical protein